jgi:Zn-dependent protease/CBS domain-containing protein
MGIPIGVHVSWFLIFGLITWSLSVGFFPPEYPGLPVPVYWVLGGITSLLFFGSVLVHELGHSILALRNGISVRGINLFIFGGVAQIEREPETPGAEFRIALAGPLTSLVLGIGFAVLWLFDRGIPFLAAPSAWLMRINLMLAFFNLIPGFPLDGGRVLRAVVWKITGSFERATQLAAFTGQLTAFGFIGFGVLGMLSGNFFNGLWLVMIGWFLQNAAATSFAQVNAQRSLRGVTVAQVMSRECPLVPGQLPLNQLVEDYVLTGGRRCFLVQDEGQLHGMLTLRDIAQVPRARWGEVAAQEIVKPRQQLIYVSSRTDLLSALRAMDDANVNQVPVIDNDELVGMLSRDQMLHYSRARAELGI